MGGAGIYLYDHVSAEDRVVARYSCVCVYNNNITCVQKLYIPYRYKVYNTGRTVRERKRRLIIYRRNWFCVLSFGTDIKASCVQRGARTGGRSARLWKKKKRVGKLVMPGRARYTAQNTYTHTHIHSHSLLRSTRVCARMYSSKALKVIELAGDGILYSSMTPVHVHII